MFTASTSGQSDVVYAMRLHVESSVPPSPHNILVLLSTCVTWFPEQQKTWFDGKLLYFSQMFLPFPTL